MINLVDQLGHPVALTEGAKRIVSLVPSQTELMHALGLEEKVVGITRFCIHPSDWHASKTRIGGTKAVDIDKIRSLNPDLIVGNKEENVREQIDLLSAEFPVYLSDVNTLGDALEMIRHIGVLTQRDLEATRISLEIEERFNAWTQEVQQEKPLRIAYLIWNEPWMCAGQQTFIHEMLRRSGLVNVFAHRDRYPITDWDEIESLEPDVIALSTEPFPFNDTHRRRLQFRFPNARCIIVPGEYFSWYGSRLLDTPSYFRRLRSELSSTVSRRKVD